MTKPNPDKDLAQYRRRATRNGIELEAAPQGQPEVLAPQTNRAAGDPTTRRYSHATGTPRLGYSPARHRKARARAGIPR